MSGKVWVPQLLDRDADEYEEKGDTDDPSHHECTHYVRHLLEVRDAKDAVVHHEETKLGPAEVEGIQNLSHNQPLRHHDNISRVEQVGVDAHTRRVHGEDETNDSQVPALIRELLQTCTTVGLFGSGTYH